MTKSLKEVPRSNYHYRPTLEELAQRRRYLDRHSSPGAPPDTGIGSSGLTDMLEKGEDGFEHYISGR